MTARWLSISVLTSELQSLVDVLEMGLGILDAATPTEEQIEASQAILRQLTRHAAYEQKMQEIEGDW